MLRLIAQYFAFTVACSCSSFWRSHHASSFWRSQNLRIGRCLCLSSPLHALFFVLRIPLCLPFRSPFACHSAAQRRNLLLPLPLPVLRRCLFYAVILSGVWRVLCARRSRRPPIPPAPPHPSTPFSLKSSALAFAFASGYAKPSGLALDRKH
jgi:hypothetical protein